MYERERVREREGGREWEGGLGVRLRLGAVVLTYLVVASDV